MREITGRKVLIFTVAAFGIIIAVNLTLAFQAVRTFPGLEVKNSYVASQSFDVDRAAQEALGWDVWAEFDDEQLTVSFTQADGSPADVVGLTALVGWATSTHDDFTPEFSRRDAGTFVAPADMARGNWNIRLEAQAPDGTVFRQRVVLHVGMTKA
ncbi:FixH family protein [Pseudoruegeria sp. SK021]|uniref:FixH family protein n=1 Tax=Pseudoruegeria sp. SK021 TaxID=1933035 RepID=UPI000A21A7EF|nr:FixH family protein [Pseudoruegeria sp. SK021]OSP56739.1 nitrogen fixation protein FixH [Pseudoruegeria sp. SK021]